MTDFDRVTRHTFSLLESLGQAVIATDAAGHIIHWSKAAQKLYGWKATEVEGRDILDITPLDVTREQGAEIMRALARGEVWSGQFDVRARKGEAFTASVTDVPLLSATGGVAGVVGVSAPAQSPTKIAAVVKRFCAACNTIWPDQITCTRKIPASSTVAATEPHLIQLLALLMLLHAEALDDGAKLSIGIHPAARSPFAEFNLTDAESSLYVRIERTGDQKPTYSVLRSFPRTTEPAKYASSLVRMVGGMLISGAAPDHLNAMHLLLPLAAR